MKITLPKQCSIQRSHGGSGYDLYVVLDSKFSQGLPYTDLIGTLSATTLKNKSYIHLAYASTCTYIGYFFILYLWTFLRSPTPVKPFTEDYVSNYIRY
jgi:hypothetical protein